MSFDGVKVLGMVMAVTEMKMLQESHVRKER